MHHKFGERSFEIAGGLPDTSLVRYLELLGCKLNFVLFLAIKIRLFSYQAAINSITFGISQSTVASF